MNTSSAWATVTGGLTALALIGTTWALVVSRENRELREEARSMRDQVAASQGLIREALEARTSAEDRLAGERRRVETVETQLAEARKAAGSPMAGTWEAGKAIPARVYLGRQAIGSGWVIHPAARGGTPAAGNTEWQVVLDEGIRQQLTPARAANPQPSGPESVTVNHVYPDSGWTYPWVVWSPGARHPDADACDGGTGGGSTAPKPGAPATAKGQPFLNTTYWRPTAKPFLPTPSPWPIVTPPQRMASAVPVARAQSAWSAPAAPVTTGGPGRTWGR